jgi:hypothetical protein
MASFSDVASLIPIYNSLIPNEKTKKLNPKKLKRTQNDPTKQTLNLIQNDQVLMEGAFVVNQDQITFSSEEGTPLCGTDPEERSATYQWYPVGSFTTAYPVEEGIGLMPVSSDKCYARSLVLATHPLKLVNPIYNPVLAQPF